ncbi:glycosyltransferase family 2 protein [Paramagnetospirillum magneticum]|uniref:Glycosyltransferase involved in cell wall biogenesis n=1 Tax=Paramagnetospirillum magneticum (strain ATCC 700264 / AMB-1) TaxID=342108 RepID=Q2VZG6_PARM1|nr:glycosyltransferase family 2 protein [Paramagnetospirillum magneticum]BAE53009.1 Glycosyltransferase involved in cell wall biogenesis [Paramagnetospirillum magneticum AMB-1]
MTSLVVPELSVVVPVKNEAENILPLLDEIHMALQGKVEFEVVYVDDGSDDATPAVLEQARAIHPRLKVVRHRTGCGQSQAVATGVKHAGGKLIATLDGDGQNDPADLPAMLEHWRSRPETVRAGLMITGWRANRRDDGIRRLSSKLANAIRSKLLRDQTPDSGSGIKLLPRELFLDLPRFDHMHRFMAALVIRAGGSVEVVKVNHRPRERGTSKYGVWNRLWVGIVDLFGVMWLMRRARNPVVECRE